MELQPLPKGFVLNEEKTGEEWKTEALLQIDWLREKLVSGDITGFLACGVHANRDAWGLGVVATGVDMGDMHESLVKLHEVFHKSVNELAEKFESDGNAALQ